MNPLIIAAVLGFATIPDVHLVDNQTPTYTYEEVHTGATGWAMDEYEALGFDMPHPGQRFNWSEYFTVLQPSETPRQWDLVEYTDDNGMIQGAIIRDVSGYGVIATKPAGDGVTYFFTVDKKAVTKYMRPHFAGKKESI